MTRHCSRMRARLALQKFLEEQSKKQEETNRVHREGFKIETPELEPYPFPLTKILDEPPLDFSGNPLPRIFFENSLKDFQEIDEQKMREHVAMAEEDTPKSTPVTLRDMTLDCSAWRDSLVFTDEEMEKHMEKRGVVTDDTKIKTADATKRCPNCRADLEEPTKCPNCGTEPFEKRESDGEGE